MNEITILYKKGYSTLLFLAILLVPSILEHQNYKLAKADKSDFTVLKEIYRSLYCSQSVGWAWIFFGLCALVILVIGHWNLITVRSQSHYFSLLISAFFNYFVMLWLLFFDLFGYSGHMNYMVFSGSGVAFILFNIVAGIVFIMVVFVPPIRAEKTN